MYQVWFHAQTRYGNAVLAHASINVSKHVWLFAVSNTKDNPPCNTLFVGNLGDTVSEPELRQLFGTLAGFRQLKLIRGARSVTCFVEFGDLPSAMACHQNQQVNSMPRLFLHCCYICVQQRYMTFLSSAQQLGHICNPKFCCDAPALMNVL